MTCCDPAERSPVCRRESRSTVRSLPLLKHVLQLRAAKQQNWGRSSRVVVFRVEENLPAARRQSQQAKQDLAEVPAL